jgi:GrpB-like predicted nucleotidyltransferase (UPF0157 family)
LVTPRQIRGRLDDVQGTDWPAWANEQVRLVDTALSSWLRAPVEHVGSSPVQGLPAKPILDLHTAVADIECAPLIAEVLVSAGWWYVPPELDRWAWRRLFVQIVDGHGVAHLHVKTLECARWREPLVFRDALRADKKPVERYAALKGTLPAQRADGRKPIRRGKVRLRSCVLDQLR